MKHKRISIMPQEQSVIISLRSAFIFQCPWFIQRQCAGSHTHTHTPPLSPPMLSMISAALRRSVQIESGMDEDVATWVGRFTLLCLLVGKVPPDRLRKRQRSSKTDRQMGLQGRQTDSETGLAVCLGCAPPSPRL